jgi:predicted transcriptional regulator
MAELTTVQIDLETDRKLKAIAAAYERSKPSQVRFWVTREYAELERLKLLPV